MTSLTVSGSGLKAPSTQSRIVVIVWRGCLAKITSYTLKLVLRRYLSVEGVDLPTNKGRNIVLHPVRYST